MARASQNGPEEKLRVVLSALPGRCPLRRWAAREPRSGPSRLAQTVVMGAATPHPLGVTLAANPKVF